MLGPPSLPPYAFVVVRNLVVTNGPGQGSA
jgi:hypothetical protein